MRGPRPPYYAVIFTSQLSGECEGYADMATRMVELASEQPGFLGMESVREGSSGITISYWESEEAVARWKSHPEHLEAQASGRGKWYSGYTVRVAKVERAHGHGEGG